MKRLKGLIPFTVSAALLAYALRDVDGGAFVEASLRAHLLLAFVTVVLSQFVRWMLRTLLVSMHFSWFHETPLPFREFLWVRGGSYLVNALSSALGAASLLLYQRRKTGALWSKVMGMLVFRAGVGGWGIVIVLLIPLTLALQLSGLAEDTGLPLFWWWLFLLGPGLAFCVRTWLFWFHEVDPLGLLSRLIVRDHVFWTSFREASPHHWFLVWALTLPSVIAGFVCMYLLHIAFGIDVPVLTLLVFLPLAVAVMDFPLSFAGFGSATVAWTAFFGAYGSPEDIVALTLFFPTARLLVRCGIGLFCWRPMMREVERLRALERP